MSHAIYLHFNGNCETAINFYKDALGANIHSMMRFSDAPKGPDAPTVSEGSQNQIMHAVLDIHGLSVLCSDCGDMVQVTFGDNFAISLDCKSDGEVHDLFNAISVGGIVKMPVQDTFWGATFGMCTDKFGVNWMFNYDKK